MNFRKILTAFLAMLLFAVPAFSQEIKPGKAVQITIQGVPLEEQQKINGQYSVTDGGTISMPMLGAVRAAGLRPGDLAANIQARYKSEGIYRNPTIQVFATEQGMTVNEELVTVGGQVRRPGPVKYSRDLTLYQAIQAAGGATEFGSLKRVTLFRGSSQKRYDVTQSQFMNIPLQPSDTIDVPQKTAFGN
jgi:protein involved in polysaccharide export with SLBB domain